MADDVRIAVGMPRHWKMKMVRRRLGPAGCWAVVTLICDTGENRPDGSLVGMSDEAIALAAEWDGDAHEFVKMLGPLPDGVGFLDGEPGAWVVHDWATWQPWIAGKPDRIESAKKAAQARWSGDGKPSAPPPTPAPAAQPARPTPAPAPSAAAPKPAAPVAPKAEPTYPPSFNRFWATYPKKVGKAQAAKEWLALRPSAELVDLICDRVEAFKGSDRWQRDGGKYVPDPERFIKHRRWDDELTIGTNGQQSGGATPKAAPAKPSISGEDHFDALMIGGIFRPDDWANGAEWAEHVDGWTDPRTRPGYVAPGRRRA